MGNNKKGTRKFSWYMKAPIRFLSKARNFYVNGMNSLNPHFNSMEAAFSCPVANPGVFPRSFSTNDRASRASHDHSELIRANSVPYCRRAGLDISEPSQVPPAQVPRSRSVGIGRINEDEPYEDEDDLKVKPFVKARSKSYVVRN